MSEYLWLISLINGIAIMPSFVLAGVTLTAIGSSLLVSTAQMIKNITFPKNHLKIFSVNNCIS